MDPALLPLDARFLNAAAVPLTLLIVKMLSSQFALSKGAKIVAVFLVPAVTVTALEAAGYGLGWQFTPILWIVATLASAGAWSLGKNVGEASQGK